MSKDQRTVSSTRLGDTGPEVFPLALGCMGMSGMYGPARDDDGVATIHAAIERGVTLLDTGDFYGMGHNEWLIRRAIEGRRDQVTLSVKFGALRSPSGGFTGVDTRPQAIENFIAYSLQRLGVDVIDIYRPARLDPNVPIEDTIGAIAKLVDKGYVRHIGLSEVGVETIRRAHAVHPIADLQIEYSLISRAPEETIFPTLRELGIGATLYSVLARGLLGGKAPAPQGDFRSILPRFSEHNRAHNQSIVERFTGFARAHDLTAGQLAIAWVLAKQPCFVPVIGARTIKQLDDALGALDQPLSAEAVAELETLVPPDAMLGTRYDSSQMAHLDSER
jgi:aryl-alcohol dehydrogenase-like predicted oxidoreductase